MVGRVRLEEGGSLVVQSDQGVGWGIDHQEAQSLEVGREHQARPAEALGILEV